MQTEILVENIRCGGCVNQIQKKLLEIDGIQHVQIDLEKQQVRIESTIDIKPQALALLTHLGYPEQGSVAGLENLKEKAKSVVSCALGRVDLMTKNTNS